MLVPAFKIGESENKMKQATFRFANIDNPG